MSTRPLTLDQQLEVEHVIDLAYEPLRARTLALSAARVRAAVAWDRPTRADRAWRGVALVARLGEVSLAACVAALLVLGTLAPAPAPALVPADEREPAGRISPSFDEQQGRFVRWMRIGRAAAIDDDIDPSAGVVRDRDPAPESVAIAERQGLLRPR